MWGYVNAGRGSGLAQSEIAVSWDLISSDWQNYSSFNHVPGGSNALFMDGHVEFIKYPGKFPASAGMARWLGGLRR